MKDSKRECFKKWARDKEWTAELVQYLANRFRGREKEACKPVPLSALRSGEAAMKALGETEDKE